MGTTISEALAAQGLDASDLEANKAGRVSEKQIARQAENRRSGGRAVWLIAVGAIAGCGVVAAWRYAHDGKAGIGIAIFMLILGLVMGAIPLGIYYAFRFADPAKVGVCAVTRLENAKVGVYLPSSSRGVYAISLNGQRYSGFATALSAAQLGTHVNAYIVPEHRIVVALEPID